MKHVWWKCPVCSHKVEAQFKFLKSKEEALTCFFYLCEGCGEWYLAQGLGMANCIPNCPQHPCWLGDQTVRAWMPHCDSMATFITQERAVNRYIRTNLRRGNWTWIKPYGNMHRALQILERQGQARYNEIRKTQWTNFELQNLLILGLAEKVQRDCNYCYLRIECILQKRKCLLVKDYLYGITSLGRKALKQLDETPAVIPLGLKRVPNIKIETAMSQEWMDYFEDRTW